MGGNDPASAAGSFADHGILCHKKGLPFGMLTVVIGGLMVAISVIFLLVRESPFDIANTQRVSPYHFLWC
ncbi:MAG: hypothetical protein KGH81_02535 [Thaumarchaeota archaeon]|nr:hypothetical protein [Nitrososphaerota archaeon]MDE1841471.1 hypothetical protein [Nitrososphaerota archaeon]MDE1878405.1 hypothetical protein [Nitrososphaerota archaeon]